MLSSIGTAFFGIVLVFSIDGFIHAFLQYTTSVFGKELIPVSAPDDFNNVPTGTMVEQLAVTWKNTELGSDELASMLLAASHVYTKAATEQSTELVWTGPTTPFVSARRTEQALLQVINSAEQSLFITSFVAYDVPTIVKALKIGRAHV